MGKPTIFHALTPARITLAFLSIAGMMFAKPAVSQINQSTFDRNYTADVNGRCRLLEEYLEGRSALLSFVNRPAHPVEVELQDGGIDSFLGDNILEKLKRSDLGAIYNGFIVQGNDFHTTAAASILATPHRNGFHSYSNAGKTTALISRSIAKIPESAGGPDSLEIPDDTILINAIGNQGRKTLEHTSYGEEYVSGQRNLSNVADADLLFATGALTLRPDGRLEIADISSAERGLPTLYTLQNLPIATSGGICLISGGTSFAAPDVAGAMKDLGAIPSKRVC